MQNNTDAEVTDKEPIPELRNFGVWTPDGLRDVTSAFRQYQATNETLERLAKVKRPSPGVSPTKDKAEVGGKPTTLGKQSEESGPKKIKLKLASPTTSAPTTSPSSPGAKDGDTG